MNKQLLIDTRFVAPIIGGIKTQSIRKKTKIQAGDIIEFNTADHSELVGVATCTSVKPVRLGETSICIGHEAWHHAKTLHTCAVSLGFRDYMEMNFFYTKLYSLPFTGKIISWKEFKTASMEALKNG